MLTHYDVLCGSLIQFFVMWKDMMEWMQKAETLLDADTSVSNDHATIKAQITKHRVRRVKVHYFSICSK